MIIFGIISAIIGGIQDSCDERTPKARAIKHVISAQYADAIEDFDEAIRQDATDGDAYVRRGRAKAKLQQYSDAIKDYDEAMRLDSNEPRTYMYRGDANYELMQYADAILDYDEALRLNLNYGIYYVYFKRGYAKFKLEQYADAIKDFGQCIRLDFRDEYTTDAYFIRARAKYAMHHYELTPTPWTVINEI